MKQQFPMRLFLALGVGIPGIFVVIGIAFVLFLGQQVELHCQRAGGDRIECQRTEIPGGLVTRPPRTNRFQLSGAKVGERIFRDDRETTTSPAQDSTLYTVLLIVDGAKVPLTNRYSSDYWEHKTRADEINQFVGNLQQATFVLKQDQRNYWFGGLFIVVGSSIAGLFITIAIVAGRVQRRIESLQNRR